MTLGNLSIFKAQRDPFFGAVIRNFGVEELENAGFFEDGSAPHLDMARYVDLNLLTTPLGKLENNLKNYNHSKGDKIAVIISSGGFCPIHQGHLAMLDSAKKELEGHGYYVAGGFVAPDHDSYVIAKCGDKAIPAYLRIKLAEKATEKSTYLCVDPWAALYLGRSVNYTDIIRHLDLYIKKHVKFTEAIEIFYVCGADNCQFSKAFTEGGGIVVVPRSGSKLDLNLLNFENQKIFIATTHNQNDISSRQIRSGNLEHLPENIEKEYREADKRTNFKKVKIYIRDEDTWTISQWQNKGEGSLEKRLKEFKENLYRQIDISFKKSLPESNIEISFLDVAEQKSKLDELSDDLKLPIISLDPCVSGNYNVSLSRRFTVTDSKRKSGLYVRPGYRSLDQQISIIPEGEYILIDDDIATGATIKEFCKLLPDKIRINKIVSLNELVTRDSLATIETNPCDILSDVVDLRDFLAGSKEGGLVVELPNGKIARVPYLLPYVRNSSRMSLPEVAEKEFSIKIWEYNYNFFKNLSPAILVKDCSLAFQNLAEYLEFEPNADMADFCLWHMQELMKSIESRH